MLLEQNRPNDPLAMFKTLRDELTEAVAVVRVILRYAPEPLTIITSMGLILSWGIWVLLPLDVLRATKPFQRLVETMPEQCWGALFLIVGLSQLSGVIRAFKTRDHRLWYWSTIAACGCWATVFFCVLTTDPFTTTMPMFFLLAWCQMLIARQI